MVMNRREFSILGYYDFMYVIITLGRDKKSW